MVLDRYSCLSRFHSLVKSKESIRWVLPYPRSYYELHRIQSIAREFYKKSLKSIDQLSTEQILCLFQLALILKHVIDQDGHIPFLSHKVLANVFLEPSTRTRLSFEVAMKRLGGHVISLDSKECSSIKKGESIHDTLCMLGLYADAIVLRSNSKLECTLPSSFNTCQNEVPIINAGDGSEEHPTQALIDLFTIVEALPEIDFMNIHKNIEPAAKPLIITIAGDLYYSRTVHSLAILLARYNVEFRLVSPANLRLPPSLLSTLLEKQRGSLLTPERLSEYDNFEKALPDSDVLYMTRIQSERDLHTQSNASTPFHPKLVDGSDYILTPQILENFSKENLKILHPLPRLEEIPIEIDADPKALYFSQAKNGLYIRMALLVLICCDEESLIGFFFSSLF